ncbi:MAG: hypothetical protein VYA32_11570 [Planctomycetota bacterium]|nr:hypothetical protein [Planctomycetota bacterium]
MQRFREVIADDLKIVLRRDRLRVAAPLADDVHGEVFGAFRLPRAAEVLEQLGPTLQAGPPDDSKQLSPQVGIGVALSRDDVLRPGFCEVKALFQVGA